MLLNPWGSASFHPGLSSHLPFGLPESPHSKPATRILQLAPKAHQDNSLGCKAQDHLEKKRERCRRGGKTAWL